MLLVKIQEVFIGGNPNQIELTLDLFFDYPISLVKSFDVNDQYLYFCDNDDRLIEYDLTSNLYQTIGVFNGIQEIIVSPHGDIYFTQFDDIVGTTKIKKYINSTTTQDFVSREFNTIDDITIDGKGNMYLSEFDTLKITRIYDQSLLGHSNVYIPDANFNTALVNNTSINTNADSEIQYTEAEAFTGSIDVNSLGILDLTGIEAFKNLTSLNCSNNSLSYLNITANGQLNQLECQSNNLIHLNTTHNIHLTTINCGQNNLVNIELSKNLALENFTAENINTLVDLDLSNNTALKELTCSSTQLTNIDLRNGTNTNITTFNISKTDNLTCIFVDEINFSINNWTNPNPGTTNFVETEVECNNTLSTEEYSFLKYKIFPNPVSSTLNINHPIKKIKLFDISGELILESKEQKINIRNLENGLYFLQITSVKNYITTKKIIKY